MYFFLPWNSPIASSCSKLLFDFQIIIGIKLWYCYVLHYSESNHLTEEYMVIYLFLYHTNSNSNFVENDRKRESNLAKSLHW